MKYMLYFLFQDKVLQANGFAPLPSPRQDLHPKNPLAGLDWWGISLSYDNMTRTSPLSFSTISTTSIHHRNGCLKLTPIHWRPRHKNQPFNPHIIEEIRNYQMFYTPIHIIIRPKSTSPWKHQNMDPFSLLITSTNQRNSRFSKWRWFTIATIISR